MGRGVGGWEEQREQKGKWNIIMENYFQKLHFIFNLDIFAYTQP